MEGIVLVYSCRNYVAGLIPTRSGEFFCVFLYHGTHENALLPFGFPLALIHCRGEARSGTKCFGSERGEENAICAIIHVEVIRG